MKLTTDLTMLIAVLLLHALLAYWVTAAPVPEKEVDMSSEPYDPWWENKVFEAPPPKKIYGLPEDTDYLTELFPGIKLPKKNDNTLDAIPDVSNASDVEKDEALDKVIDSIFGTHLANSSDLPATSPIPPRHPPRLKETDMDDLIGAIEKNLQFAVPNNPTYLPETYQIPAPSLEDTDTDPLVNDLIEEIENDDHHKQPQISTPESTEYPDMSQIPAPSLKTSDKDYAEDLVGEIKEDSHSIKTEISMPESVDLAQDQVPVRYRHMFEMDHVNESIGEIKDDNDPNKLQGSMPESTDLANNPEMTQIPAPRLENSDNSNTTEISESIDLAQDQVPVRYLHKFDFVNDPIGQIKGDSRPSDLQTKPESTDLTQDPEISQIPAPPLENSDKDYAEDSVGEIKDGYTPDKPQASMPESTDLADDREISQIPAPPLETLIMGLDKDSIGSMPESTDLADELETSQVPAPSHNDVDFANDSIGAIKEDYLSNMTGISPKLIVPYENPETSQDPSLVTFAKGYVEEIEDDYDLTDDADASGSGGDPSTTPNITEASGEMTSDANTNATEFAKIVAKFIAEAKAPRISSYNALDSYAPGFEVAVVSPGESGWAKSKKKRPPKKKFTPVFEKSYYDKSRIYEQVPSVIFFLAAFFLMVYFVYWGWKGMREAKKHLKFNHIECKRNAKSEVDEEAFDFILRHGEVPRSMLRQRNQFRGFFYYDW